MQTLSIDIETYSDVNLSKCGVYKYAESPDFEILLFGYSSDGSEVTVIDLAQGERLPQEIIDALTDDTVIKWAFNANFERVCLSRYLRDLGVSLDPFHDNHPISTECARFLNPESWRCSMIWAATMGLPLSLEGVGAVLGLEKQKLTEGKELIKLFCQPCVPTKANNGRTRNRPEDEPVKWAAFKRYNVRDVETEMSIQERLKKFPVPDFIWDEYHIDQEIAWLAGEAWRQEVFAKGGDIYCASASQMFKVPVEKHGINSHLRQKGKIAELALGYGGSVGALKAMGAIEMGLTEDELPPLVEAWRQSNPHIVMLWWDVDHAAMEAVKYHSTVKTHGILFSYRSGMLFITLPSGRSLAYVKPKIGTNKFGGECITFEGTGGTKKWERLDTYGPKLVENIVQATSRDILCHAMKTLRCCSIVMHIHDELVIEADPRMSLDAVCEQMGRTPPWADGLLLRADGYETEFYKKD